MLLTGVWATKLGEMAGVKVPLIALHHAYVVTERIEGIQVGQPPVDSTSFVQFAFKPQFLQGRIPSFLFILVIVTVY